MPIKPHDASGLTIAQQDAARKARRDYMRKWRQKNRQRERQIQMRYWAKKAQQDNNKE